MISNRKAVRIAGVLFLLQMTAAVISHEVILSPLLGGSDFLADVAAQATEVKIAILFDLVCGASVFGIAVLLFPILKQHSERIALWYVGLRLGELFAWVAAGTVLLILLSTGQQFVQAGMPESSHFEVLGKALRSGRNSTVDLNLIVYCLSASTFYYLLFRSKLIPRFLSVWGLLAVLLLFTEVMLIIFTKTFRMWMMMPMGLNELVLGIWLIVKGFNTTATTARSTIQ
ncbi:DUF4386 domain-containing protein [Spongiimicrobium sp. 2-473A-2-J]|uniref:DUF4386 domain-containing protein n=1 Tax=Eudoraea algarum TaxID=3417568 RepID=UPI003D36369D